ncbi:MAG: hypothetical protein KIT74_11020 [Fimbriimonadales bacterium]|nr:hypothetical protein [Fimbriimonadales bacterium]
MPPGFSSGETVTLDGVNQATRPVLLVAVEGYYFIENWREGGFDYALRQLMFVDEIEAGVATISSPLKKWVNQSLSEASRGLANSYKKRAGISDDEAAEYGL